MRDKSSPKVSNHSTACGSDRGKHRHKKKRGTRGVNTHAILVDEARVSSPDAPSPFFSLPLSDILCLVSCYIIPFFEREIDAIREGLSDALHSWLLIIYARYSVSVAESGRKARSSRISASFSLGVGNEAG